MAQVTATRSYSTGDTLTAAYYDDDRDEIIDGVNSINNSQISATAAIVATKISGTAVTLAGTETLTNKTLTSPVLNTGVSGTALLDEDDMVTDSATQVATQQSIKAYVDAISVNRAFTWFLSGTQIAANELGAKYIVPQSMTVTKIWWKTGSGTATLRLQKNTTDINASMSATTSVGSDDSITSAALTAGQVITLDITAISSGANISVTMECEQ